MIRIESKGSFLKTEAFLKRNHTSNVRRILEKYGQQGVVALTNATPRRTGLTAGSWDYKIMTTQKGLSLTWVNTNVESGFPVAAMIQYGYTTGTGGYVAGQDYINPALRPIFDRMSAEIRREVNNG